MNTVTASAVPAKRRMGTLPKHFGSHMMRVENAIYTWMDAHAAGYTGGFWKFSELSNGGFFMSPDTDERFVISIPSNGYEGEMSAEAAGITACLFIFSALSFDTSDERISDHYHWLREFARTHPDWSAIGGATD